MTLVNILNEQIDQNKASNRLRLLAFQEQISLKIRVVSLFCLIKNPLSKRFLYASKPSTLSALFWICIFGILPNARIILDVTDNLLRYKYNFANIAKKLVFLLSLWQADSICVCSEELKKSLPIFTLSKCFVIRDALDKQQLPNICNNHHDKNSYDFLWFGNALSQRSNKNSWSPSFDAFIRFLDSNQQFFTAKRIAVCSNFISKSATSSFINTEGVIFLPWSIPTLKETCINSKTILLTYGNDKLAKLKSTNRLELAITSGLPTVIINPPAHWLSNSYEKELLKACFVIMHDQDKINESNLRLYYRNFKTRRATAINHIIDSQQQILESWQMLFTNL